MNDLLRTRYFGQLIRSILSNMNDLGNRSQRLKQFCTVYGTDDYQQLLSLVAEVLAHMGDKEAMAATLGSDTAGKLESEGRFAHWRAEYRAFCRHRPQLDQNL